jgi:hypothetical protein
LYITQDISYAPDLYRSSDFGGSWISVDPLFATKVYLLLDVGSVAGEIYAIHFRSDDTLELKYSNNYGNTFSSIIIDTNIIINSNMVGTPIFTHGATQGEFYLIRGANDGFHIFHTSDNGKTFEHQCTKPICPQCNIDLNLCSYSAGRTPGTFYYMRAPKIDSLGHIMTNLCIDFSEDYGKTFTTYCYILDSTFTSIENKLPYPKTYQLSCGPNPLWSTAEINYFLPVSGEVDIRLINLQGKQISLLLNEKKSMGQYSFSYNGKDNHGTNLTPGVYFLILKVNGIQVKSQKVVVME